MQIAAVSILLSIIASATPSTTPSAVPSAEYDFARRFDPEIVMRAYEGHHFAESLSGNGRVLVLNGVGLRKSAAKVYIAALYLEHRMRTSGDVLWRDETKKLVIRFVKPLSKEEIAGEIGAGLRRGVDLGSSSMTEKIDAFARSITSVEPEDEIVLLYAPGKGTTISIKGKEVGRIEGADFARALFSTWFGPSPVQDSLRDGLLGAR